MPSETPLSRRQLREAETRPQRPRRPRRRRIPIGQKLFSAAALLFAGALLVGTSLPANALFTDASASGVITELDGQAMKVSADVLAETSADRSDFSVTSYAEVLNAHRSGSYTPTTGAIRWPYPYASPITDGFGHRNSPCAGCSSDHKGIDFTPGAGVVTYSIAAGVVESSVVSNGGLGNVVIINHTINGQSIQSVYGHMQSNSSTLKAGDVVKAGDPVGKVGMTGSATGPNMHLEIHVNGVAVDPFTWLTKNARD
jgi:murein DD-endopeptidase MepM/ murein hydrolase activator NlpD